MQAPFVVLHTHKLSNNLKFKTRRYTVSERYYYTIVRFCQWNARQTQRKVAEYEIEVQNSTKRGLSNGKTVVYCGICS